MQAAWPKGRDILARGVLAVTLKRGAIDFADGARLSREAILRREYHHLFPDHLLTEEGKLTPAESYRALNCALITWKTNRHISAKEPIRYLRERTEQNVLGEEEVRLRLDSHLVPFDALNVGGYELLAEPGSRASRIRADYEAFLSARAEMLVQPIGLLCDGFRWPA